MIKACGGNIHCVIHPQEKKLDQHNCLFHVLYIVLTHLGHIVQVIKFETVGLDRLHDIC